MSKGKSMAAAKKAYIKHEKAEGPRHERMEAKREGKSGSREKC